MKIIENKKGFKILKLNHEEIKFLRWGTKPFNECLCMNCNKPIPVNDIYFIPVLGDLMDKECYEEWYKNATRYPEDISYEENSFNNILKILKEHEKKIINKYFWINISKININSFEENKQYSTSRLFSSKIEAEIEGQKNPNYICTTKIQWEE